MLAQSVVSVPLPATCFKETGRKGKPSILMEELSNLGAEVHGFILPISSKTGGARENDTSVLEYPTVTGLGSEKES